MINSLSPADFADRPQLNPDIIKICENQRDQRE